MDTPNFRMDGRVALLTGAGRGIGLAMARALASVGCAVAIQDIEKDVAEAEAGKIRNEGGKAMAIGGDVTDLSLAARAVPEVVRLLGGLHVLINNAAIQKREHWLEMSLEEMEKELRADLIAPIAFCQQATPIFKRQKWGRIINISSIQEKGGNENMLPYAISKLALENVTKPLARDLAKEGITVNTIAPGFINTYRNRHQFRTKEDLERMGKQHVPQGTIGEPEEFAGITLLLCSDAGRYITGQTIFVDGGMSAR
jgi:glucose 1-dehydrogenase